MNYYLSTIIHLSLEPFHNAGLTPEETKAILENMVDPSSRVGARFWVEQSGINSNWNIRCVARSTDMIEYIMEEICYSLCRALKEKGKELPFGYSSYEYDLSRLQS